MTTLRFLTEEERRWRIAHGLPPELPGELRLPETLAPVGPLAVPTGTTEKPPPFTPAERQTFQEFIEQQEREEYEARRQRTLRTLRRPLMTPEMVEALPSVLQPLGRGAREMTSPLQLLLSTAIAGVGPGLVAGARGPVAGILAPIVEGPFAARFAGETALGTGASTAAIEAERRISETAPVPVRIGVPLVAGLVGGAGTLGAIRAAPVVGRTGKRYVGRAATQAAQKAAPVARRLAMEEAGAVGKVPKKPITKPVQEAEATARRGIAEPAMTPEEVKRWDTFRASSPEWVAADKRVVSGPTRKDIVTSLAERDAISDSLWADFEKSGRISTSVTKVPSFTTPVASEALSPAANPAQATKGVTNLPSTWSPQYTDFLRRFVGKTKDDFVIQRGGVAAPRPQWAVRLKGTTGEDVVGRFPTRSAAATYLDEHVSRIRLLESAEGLGAEAVAPVAERVLPVRGPIEPIRQIPVGAKTPEVITPGRPAVAEAMAGKASTGAPLVETPPIYKEGAAGAEAMAGKAPTGGKAAAEQVLPLPVSAAPPTKPLVRTPSEATAQVKAVQQEGLKASETISIQDAKSAHVEMGAPDGPQPPKPPRPTAKGVLPSPDDSADIVRQIAARATQGERPDQTLLRLHGAAITNEARRNGIIVRDGNAQLQALGIGVTRRGQLIPRTEDIPKLDELYNALHNPTKVASGEMHVPEGYEAIYAELRRLTDWEQAARLGFDPAMATVDDYFYRGWKPPEGAFATGLSQGRPLVRTPAFKKPRVDATYKEMRDAGFEPLFWNPYHQWGLSRMQGTKYREQMELVDYLKGMGDDFARPHLGGPIPKGWRVPEVGPAFEGKPFATLDAAGEPTTMFTRRWIVPDRVANTLENIYGKRPDLGKLTIGGKTIDPLSVIDFLTFVPKRAKLMVSLFQQVDFLARAGGGGWTRMVDALSAGQPIEAVKALAHYPVSAATIIRSNFSPGLRQSLARQLDSTEPLIVGRAGVNLKGISEAGLSTFDPAMFRWEDMDKVVREVVQETGVLGKVRGAARAVGDLESAMRRGLFEGVYPAAMITDIQNNIAPMVARMYPKLNDAQLNGTIARIVNIKYSSIPASQSVLQNRVLRETLRRVFFSIGESEGLLRQAAGVVSGPNKKFWMKHWLGTYLFVIATAAAIHYASTGKPLPKERFTPVTKDKWGPLPFGYNTRFASPTIPLKGRGGAELTLDVVGQMDTALRILNPGQFLTARESVPIRAIVNQASGTDFFGNRIDDVGPGGVISRTAQLAQDMYSPIGAGGLASEVARRNIPGAEQVIQEGEARLGLTGLGAQATGLNLRAATREQRLKSTLGPAATTTLKALDKLGLDLGYVTRRFDMESGVKGGEVTLTSEQREQFQWLTDDVVVAGLAPIVTEDWFQKQSKQDKIDQIKAEITRSRKVARNQFRNQLLTRQTGVKREQTTQDLINQGLILPELTPTPAGVR